MKDWTNYQNPAHLNPFDYEAFSQSYSQYGQSNHASTQSSQPSNAASFAPPPALQGLRNHSSDRQSTVDEGLPPRSPDLAERIRQMGGPPALGVDMSMLPSPGTIAAHEMEWRAAVGSEFAPPFASISAGYSGFSHEAEAGNMYMPYLPPLPQSPWEEWMRRDDLALQGAATAYGAVGPASTSSVYNVESPQAQQARSNLVSTLTSALADLEGLLHSNSDPELAGYPIKQLDHRITPLLIAAENWRRPGLNLIALHTHQAATVDSDDEEMGEQAPMAGSQEIRDFVKFHPDGRYRALVDNGQHTRAADIHKSQSGVSVVLLDPLKAEKDETDYDDYAVNFKQEFAAHAAARCAFIPLDLQKSAFGCRIFSMSLALKMQAREDDFTNMHGALYRGDLWNVVRGSMQTDDDEDAHVVLDAGPLIDASMLKHNQSRTSIGKYLKENPDQEGAVVNTKHGETLRKRTRRHTVQREVLANKDSGQVTKTIKFNNSIELKRIALIRRALNFVSVAPASDVIRLSALIGQSIDRPNGHGR